MASFIFTEAKRLVQLGSINLLTDDIRTLLCMLGANTPAKSDANALSDITLDEFSGTNYVRKVLAGRSVVEDNILGKAEFRASNVVWTALGAGARAVLGAITYKHVGAEATNIPIVWHEFSGSPNGSDATLQWDALGLLRLA